MSPFRGKVFLRNAIIDCDVKDIYPFTDGEYKCRIELKFRMALESGNKFYLYSESGEYKIGIGMVLNIII